MPQGLDKKDEDHAQTAENSQLDSDAARDKKQSEETATAVKRARVVDDSSDNDSIDLSEEIAHNPS